MHPQKNNRALTSQDRRFIKQAMRAMQIKSARQSHCSEERQQVVTPQKHQELLIVQDVPAIVQRSKAHQEEGVPTLFAVPRSEEMPVLSPLPQKLKFLNDQNRWEVKPGSIAQRRRSGMRQRELTPQERQFVKQALQVMRDAQSQRSAETNCAPSPHEQQPEYINEETPEAIDLRSKTKAHFTEEREWLLPPPTQRSQILYNRESQSQNIESRSATSFQRSEETQRALTPQAHQTQLFIKDEAPRSIEKPLASPREQTEEIAAIPLWSWYTARQALHEYAQQSQLLMKQDSRIFDLCSTAHSSQQSQTPWTLAPHANEPEIFFRDACGAIDLRCSTKCKLSKRLRSLSLHVCAQPLVSKTSTCFGN